MTLPQDPGEASLKGQVSIKNTKGEPVACVALDIQAPDLRRFLLGLARWRGGMMKSSASSESEACTLKINRNRSCKRWDSFVKPCQNQDYRKTLY